MPAESSHDRGICQLLLDHSANVRIKDNNGDETLYCLASRNVTSTAACIVDYVATEKLASLLLYQGEHQLHWERLLDLDLDLSMEDYGYITKFAMKDTAVPSKCCFASIP